MLRLLADENLNNAILRGLRLRKPDADVVRVQDVGLLGADDPTILEWAAQEGRVLLTHDAATIPYFAYERIRAGEPMAGVCEIKRSLPVGEVIEDLLVLIECSVAEDWVNQVQYLPL